MSENPLLKKYRFVKLTEKAARITRANKIQLLEMYAAYEKAADMAKEDFINEPEIKYPFQYEKAIVKINTLQNTIAVLGYTIEIREGDSQHDKQKNKENK